MNSLGSFHRRWRLEVALVLVPLVAIVALQYVWSARLAKVELIAHQSTLLEYLETVAAAVRRTYEDATNGMLDVPGDALAAKRFDVIAGHFDGVDTSAASLLFAGSLEGCWCLTEYYDPKTGHMGIGAEPALELVVARITMLLRVEWKQHLNRTRTYVDELDAENRVLYRFVTDADSPVGFVGFVVNTRRFERQYLPQAIARAADMLPDDVRDNVIVRVTDRAGRVAAATHDEPGQDDALTGSFDFVFRDLELSARSRHTVAAQVLQTDAMTRWVLSTLMTVMAIGSVLLTWRSARRERRLSQIRNRFVASVSHELRTPLTSLAVFGELMRRGRVTAPDRIIEYGRRIEQESSRLRHLVENVLSFGRIESAEVRYRREAAAIEDVVSAAVAAVDTRRAQGGFAITVTAPKAGLAPVPVDATAMTQVFVNLLDNAMKYSGRCRQVQVELGRRGDDVAITVADEGIGIAPDDQGRIFEEFFRAAAAREEAVGTGLGLAIARHIVQAHGGRIEVDSRSDHGTAFTVLLPVARFPVRQVRVRPAMERVQTEAGA